MTLRRVLVELNVTEQRFRAVSEVQAGSPVTEVADRFGVSRRAAHQWLRWYAAEGLEVQWRSATMGVRESWPPSAGPRRYRRQLSPRHGRRCGGEPFAGCG